jgi:acetyl esterase
MPTLVRPARPPRPPLLAVPVKVGARVVRAVPDRIARRFVRERIAGGETVHPHMHYALLLQRLSAVGDEREPGRMRAEHRLATLGAAGPSTPVGSATDVRFDGPAGTMVARHYVPDVRGGQQLPLLVYYHGGGFVAGDLDSVDQICRLLCVHGCMQVFSVDYRLAPEHPFPAAVDDADFAFRWAHARAERLGADPDRVAVAGDSAGGTLAAVVSQRAAGRSRHDPTAPVPGAQLLIYPSMHHHSDYPSRRSYSTGFFLEQEDMDWFFTSYVEAGQSSSADPEVSPLLAHDLKGLPPTLIITAAFDPLRDEAEAYAARLSEAGVPVLLRRIPGMLHGFFNMTGMSRDAHGAVLATAGSLAALLECSSSLRQSAAGASRALP